MFCISCLTLNLPLNEQRKSQINLPLFFQPRLIRCQNNCNYRPIITPNPYEYVLKCVILCYQNLFVRAVQLSWNFCSKTSLYTWGKMYETEVVLQQQQTNSVIGAGVCVFLVWFLLWVVGWGWFVWVGFFFLFKI